MWEFSLGIQIEKSLPAWAISVVLRTGHTGQSPAARPVAPPNRYNPAPALKEAKHLDQRPAKIKQQCWCFEWSPSRPADCWQEASPPNCACSQGQCASVLNQEEKGGRHAYSERLPTAGMEGARTRVQLHHQAL